MTDINDILIVDDNPSNLSILGSMLRNENYKVRPAPSARVALTAIESMPPALILLDVNMPEMTGYELCELIKKNPEWKNIPVIFVTALTGTVDKLKGFKLGAVDYITKPYNHEEVKARVSTHLKLYELQQGLENSVKKALKELTQMQSALIFSLAKLAQSRDDDTGKHLERVQEFCKRLAVELSVKSSYADELPESFVRMIYETSPLHDIGKVAIPDSILLKPDKLTPEEFEKMKRHTSIGADTLNQVIKNCGQNDFLMMGKVIARHHHEKWNGSGYPDGLSGGRIPLAARIMSLVDIYDALRSQRCYKAAFTHTVACEIIQKMSGVELDPEIVNCFIRISRDFEVIYANFEDTKTFV